MPSKPDSDPTNLQARLVQAIARAAQGKPKDKRNRGAEFNHKTRITAETSAAMFARARRCAAKRRDGGPCGNPAMKGRACCMMHTKNLEPAGDYVARRELWRMVAAGQVPVLALKSPLFQALHRMRRRGAVILASRLVIGAIEHEKTGNPETWSEAAQAARDFLDVWRPGT